MPDTHLHDPDARLDYLFDWQATGDPFLGVGETISSYTLTASGVTIDADSSDDTTVTVWVTGGTAGTTGSITCRVTTSAGRIEDKTMFFKIKEK